MTTSRLPEPAAVPAAEDLLGGWIGLDPTIVGSGSIARAVQSRMEALGIADPAAVVSLARRDTAERDRLVEEVVVGESWFFRDPQVFSFVCRAAALRAALPGRPPIRILSAPCAGGEEPYSLAMGLLEAGLAADRFTIDAIDVSHVALERARRARYTANAFRNADNSFHDRWFQRDGQLSTLDESVRRLVRFSWANLLDPSFPDEPLGTGTYDVVFCRNLLIYLSPEARGRAERVLDRLVAADGLLVLGAAEPPIIRGDWLPAGDTSVFALRRGIRSADQAAPLRPAARRPEPSSPPRVREAAVADAAAPGPAPASSLDDVLREAGALANARQFATALELCVAHTRAAGPDPQLFFLMGMLHQSAGDPDRAEGCFHKTLYLDAAHDEALLALALLAAQRGDALMAEKYRQSAARILSRKASP